jgi:glyoxylase-like metal-dependent hydrolase (beta-lactamase superfamily II)
MNPTTLSRVGLVLGAWACAGTAVAQDGAPAEFRQVAPDLYFNFDYDGSNSAVLMTDEGVLVVDTRTHPDDAARLLAEIRQLTDAPIRYVVTSQHHGDHYMGNVVFAREGATFIAHEDTKAEILERFQAELGTRFAARSQDPNAVVLVLPDIVFSDRLTLELGGRTVELIYLGPGQNEGDTLVYFPHARALHTGGVFHNRSWANTSFTPSMEGWVDVLRAMQAIDADIYLPPHGDLATAADVDAFTDFIAKLGTGVRSSLDDGMTLEQVLETLTFEEYADWRGYERRPRNLTAIYELMGSE